MRAKVVLGIVVLGLIGYAFRPASTAVPVAKIDISRLMEGGTGHLEVRDYSLMGSDKNPPILGIGSLKVMDDYDNVLEDIYTTDPKRYTDDDQASMAYWYDQIVAMLEREHRTIYQFQ